MICSPCEKAVERKTAMTERASQQGTALCFFHWDIVFKAYLQSILEICQNIQIIILFLKFLFCIIQNGII